MNKKMRFLVLGVLALAIIVPIFAFAQLIPCGGLGQEACTLCHLFDLAQTIINKLTTIIAPAIAVLAFTVGGFKILMSGPNPGLRSEGMKAIRNGIIGLLIVFGSWIIVNEFLLFFVGSQNITSLAPWSQITCVPPIPPKTPSIITPSLGFNNEKSPELIAFASCIKANVPGVKITEPTTDSRIFTGKCNPTDPNESFNDSNNCIHAQYSCHYGGKTCTQKGSYAFDFTASSATDPIYIAVTLVAPSCVPSGGTSGPFIQFEGNPAHGHVSIGAAFGCGCN